MFVNREANRILSQCGSLCNSIMPKFFFDLNHAGRTSPSCSEFTLSERGGWVGCSRQKQGNDKDNLE